jgi:hypothetical protein
MNSQPTDMLLISLRSARGSNPFRNVRDTLGLVCSPQFAGKCI